MIRVTCWIFGAGVGGSGAETAAILAVKQVLIGQMRQSQRVENAAVGSRSQGRVKNGAATAKSRRPQSASDAAGERRRGHARNHASQ